MENCDLSGVLAARVEYIGKDRCDLRSYLFMYNLGLDMFAVWDLMEMLCCIGEQIVDYISYVLHKIGKAFCDLGEQFAGKKNIRW
jgi:hypothetical protein